MAWIHVKQFNSRGGLSRESIVETIMRFCNWKYEVLGEDPLDLFNSLFGDSIITSGSNSSGTRDLADDEEGEGEDGDEETHEESPSPSTNSENSRFTCGKI